MISSGVARCAAGSSANSARSSASTRAALAAPASAAAAIACAAGRGIEPTPGVDEPRHGPHDPHRAEPGDALDQTLRPPRP